MRRMADTDCAPNASACSAALGWVFGAGVGIVELALIRTPIRAWPDADVGLVDA